MPSPFARTGDQPAYRVSLATMQDLSARLMFPQSVKGVYLSCEATQGRTNKPPSPFPPKGEPTNGPGEASSWKESSAGKHQANNHDPSTSNEQNKMKLLEPLISTSPESARGKNHPTGKEPPRLTPQQQRLATTQANSRPIKHGYI